ncbi:MAG: hypothetical protein H6843_04775 [Rhodospirillaceae bacterium]|nr:hypothetical protein [Rhodospirillaceae bacterium]
MTFLNSLSADTVALAIAATTVVIISFVLSILSVVFTIERRKLPQAVRNGSLEIQVASKQAHLDDLNRQIVETRRNLTESAEAEAEAGHWHNVVDGLKAEYAGLAEQRREIEAERQSYRDAVEARGAAEKELGDTLVDLELKQAELERLAQQIDQAEAKLGAGQEELEQRLRTLAAECDTRAMEARALDERLATVRAEWETLHQQVSDAEAALSRLAVERAELQRALEEGEAQLVQLQRQIEYQERLADETGRLRQELAAIQQEHEHARADVEALKQQRIKLDDDVAAQADRHTRLHAQCEILDDRRAHLQEQCEALAAQTGGLPGGNPGGHPAGGDDPEAALADLRRVPECLNRTDWRDEIPVSEDESAMLDRLALCLKDAKLEFPRRTLNAFHTSLKTAVISPLAVLAGISGTGKSQMPRYYAEVMGIHFLKIPVQPRWDSPQDLFGFYNYLEQRYKATDLARAMVHLDRFNWPEDSGAYGDRMLMVLLDEMNLARIEYYFSEFLSRLEGRPIDDDKADAGARSHSEMLIDIQRTEKGVHKVYPVQNVLFVGTMNEDESTLSLSDKVLDRANILRFGKPKDLQTAIPDHQEIERATGYLSRQRWAGWRRLYETSRSISSDQKSTAEGIVKAMNDALDLMHRPFAHRMNQAILHYVVNYPQRDQDFLRHALADQMELRILPKLRGVDASAGHPRDGLQQLEEIARKNLNDRELAAAIHTAIEEADGGDGMFTWRGLSRTE